MALTTRAQTASLQFDWVPLVPYSRITTDIGIAASGTIHDSTDLVRDQAMFTGL